MRYLITGVCGMAGSHLADHLLSGGYGTVAGIARHTRAYQHPRPFKLYSVDLMDYQQVKHCVSDFRPDVIFHLAAQTFVPKSWSNPQETFTNNTIGQINLLEAVLEVGLDPIVHVASSGEVYGKVMDAEIPLQEDQAFCPTSPYALSKVAQEYIAKQYEESHRLRMIITRTFNHTGPRRGEQYVESDFAKQLAEIELGLRPPEILVGNLSAQRDFMDVRDVVRAYAELAQRGLVGNTYQICSGSAVSIAKLLDILIALTGLSVKVSQDPGRLRKVDVPVLYGIPTKLQSAVSWRPQYSIEQTLVDLLNYWRQKLGSESAAIQA